MSLKFYETKNDLKEALELTKKFPSLFYVYYSVETELLGRFPETKPYVFLYEEVSGQNLWIVLRKNFVYHL